MSAPVRPHRPVTLDAATRREIADRMAAEHSDRRDALVEYGREVARAKRESAGIVRQNDGVFEIDADEVAP